MKTNNINSLFNILTQCKYHFKVIVYNLKRQFTVKSRRYKAMYIVVNSLNYKQIKGGMIVKTTNLIHELQIKFH